MHKICQYGELAQIVNSNKHKESNYYFMKDKIIDLINKERLSVDSFEGNTFIYEDCGSFYRMYFFIDKDIDLLKINVEDKDVVVELPFNRVLNEHQILQ